MEHHVAIMKGWGGGGGKEWSEKGERCCQMAVPSSLGDMADLPLSWRSFYGNRSPYRQVCSLSTSSITSRLLSWLKKNKHFPRFFCLFHLHKSLVFASKMFNTLKFGISLFTHKPLKMCVHEPESFRRKSQCISQPPPNPSCTPPSSLSVIALLCFASRRKSAHFHAFWQQQQNHWGGTVCFLLWEKHMLIQKEDDLLLLQHTHTHTICWRDSKSPKSLFCPITRTLNNLSFKVALN